MNLFKECTTNDIKLLEDVGVKTEDRECTTEELRKVELQITDFIMSSSKKDISSITKKYNHIFDILR